MASSNPSESASFALRVLTKVRRLVDTAKPGEEKAEQWRKSILNPSLFEIECWLRYDADQAHESQINGILSLLQGLCEGDPKRRALLPGKSPEDGFPTLAKLLKSSLHQREVAKSLQNLLSSSKLTKERVEKSRERFAKRLEIITKSISASASAGLSEPMVEKTEEEDFSAHANVLYDVLTRYSVCRDPEGDTEIVPKISLKGYQKHSESGSTFDVLFPDHPHQHGMDQSYRWQNAVIQIPAEVAFKDSGDKPLNTGQIEYHEFCGTISQQQREQLFLTVSRKDAKLCKTSSGEPGTDQRWMWTGSDSKSILLRDILAFGHLSDLRASQTKMQTYLLYLLAKGVWQFYDSQLMPKEWTKDTVEFLFEYRQREHEWILGVFLNQPLVSTRQNLPAQQDRGTRGLSHQFPKLLELGIMMVEILVGREVESYRSDYPCYLTPDGQPTSLTDAAIARHIYRHKIKTSHMSLPKLITDAVGACFDDQMFRPKPGNRDNPNYLREAIYDRVVRPIESYFSVFDDHDDLDPLVKRDGKVHLQSSTASHEDFGRYDRRSRMGRETDFAETPRSTHIKSDIWFENVDRLNELLRARNSERDAEYDQRKVKIAVLDTGVSENLAVVSEAGWYRDFVDGQDHRMQDVPGHGTDMVSLIYKVVEDPIIYVARVFETKEANDDTPALVAKAICWAVEKRVDIIVMALGFPEDDRAIKTAIRSAVGHDILVFAGAGNWAGHDKVAFPARLSNVMCVFATDPGNKNSRDLNPPPRPRQQYNFAILGDGVEIPGADGALHITRGTSVATAIAAGFAASLLDFSRQPVCREESDGSVPLDICGYDEMSKIFGKLSEDYRDGAYDCIVPWHLLKQALNSGDREAKRRKLWDILAAWAEG